MVPAYNEGDGVKLTLATIDELAEVRMRTRELACAGGHCCSASLAPVH